MMSCWQGNVDALLQLGDSHWYGRGVNRSWSTAAQLYQAASKFGNAQALFNLGLMHEYGAGLPQVTALESLFLLMHKPDAQNWADPTLVRLSHCLFQLMHQKGATVLRHCS